MVLFIYLLLFLTLLEDAGPVNFDDASVILVLLVHRHGGYLPWYYCKVGMCSVPRKEWLFVVLLPLNALAVHNSQGSGDGVGACVSGTLFGHAHARE